jgi:hypothetical protein
VSLWIEWTGTYRVQEVGALTVRDEEASLPNESLMVPLARVLNVRFRGGLAAASTRALGRDLAVFETVPGKTRRRTLALGSRQDRETAEALTDRSIRRLRNMDGLNIRLKIVNRN